MARLEPILLLVTDVGFLLYWGVSLGHLLPASWLYRDAADPVLAAWNLSFLPLDLVVSASGLASFALSAKCPGSARTLRIVSLVATSISGLQALAFWGLRGDFEASWWIANGVLLLWPLPFLAERIWRADVEGSPIPVT